MARGADFLEDLKAALQLAPVKGAEDALVLPVLTGDVRRVAGRKRCVATKEREHADQPGQQDAAHHVFSPDAAGAAAAVSAGAAAVESSPPPFSTD